MARPLRSSILHSLALLTLLAASSANDDDQDYWQKALGVLGTHYSIKRGRPYIRCEEWGPKDPPHDTHCGPSDGTDFFGKRYGCSGLFKVNKEIVDQYRGTEMVLEPHEYTPISGGCWDLQSSQTSDQCITEDECIAVINEDEVKTGIAFCCCTTHFCNKNVTVRFGKPNITSDEVQEEEIVPVDAAPLWLFTFTLAFLLLCFLLFCTLYRFIKARILDRVLKDQKVFDLQMAEDVPLVTMNDGKKRDNLKEGLTLVEIIAEGKMGLVHKGSYKDPGTGEERTVAVKTVQDQKSFLLEETAYRLCANSHDHLTHFLGSNYEPENGIYYVVLEYHEMGNLENHLKDTTFTPLEALSFLCSFMDGLSFLHCPSTLPSGHKSAIVHRDIKSRNILVRADRTAAIADLGLAMVYEADRPQGRHYQVGTHRYMSPELLVGMANLNLDGLKQADIYAASLIIWEILNRTLVDEEDEVQPAQVPYSLEVEEAVAADEASFNEHRSGGWEEFTRKPVLYYLKTIVHRDNRRPVMRKKLKDHRITNELLKTTLDMWDYEVDARISAACAHSRLHLLKQEVS